MFIQFRPMLPGCNKTHATCHCRPFSQQPRWLPGVTPGHLRCRNSEKQLPTPRLLTGTKRVGYSNTEQTKLEERFCTHFFKNLIQDTLVIRLHGDLVYTINSQFVAMSSLQISNISTMSMDMTNPGKSYSSPKNGAMMLTVIFVYRTGQYFQDVQWLLPKD